MIRTIHKYPIAIHDSKSVPMPRGAKIICCQAQFGQLSLWAEVDPSAPYEPVFIEVFGTGHPMPEADRTYIGTVQMDEGFLIWHVYQLHHLQP